jgi:hypothetical protein
MLRAGGMSVPATVLVTGVAKNTIVKLAVDLGQVCSELQDGAFNNRYCKTIEYYKIIEAAEIWPFRYSKRHSATPSKGTCPISFSTRSVLGTCGSDRDRRGIQARTLFTR